MTAVLVPKPETTPVADPTEATEPLLLLQLPPATASDKFVVKPEQTLSVPAMGAGITFTVYTELVEQPLASV